MKIQLQRTLDSRHLRLVLRFGAAELLALPDGRLELRGGTEADRTDAKEYISLFMQHAVPRVVPEPERRN